MRPYVNVVVDKTDPVDRRVVIPSATVYIYAEDTTTPVALYDAKTGGAPLTQPLTTDLLGRVCGMLGQRVFLDEPADVDVYAIDPMTGEEQTIPYPGFRADDLGGRIIASALVDTAKGPTSGATPLTIVEGQLNFVKRPGVPVEIAMSYGKLSNSNASGKASLNLAEGATLILYAAFDAAVIDEGEPGIIRRILPDDNLALAAGAHTFDLTLTRGAAGNASLYADEWMPTLLTVKEG